jgi:hypothetical protein
MIGEIHQVTPAQLQFLLPGMDSAMLDAVKLSRQLLVGRIGDEVLCVVGFIPRSFISEEAYIWLHATPAASAHKLIFGRHARVVIRRALEVYEKLIGHCFSGNSRRWLETLGAEFITDDVFEIRRA